MTGRMLINPASGEVREIELVIIDPVTRECQAKVVAAEPVRQDTISYTLVHVGRHEQEVPE